MEGADSTNAMFDTGGPLLGASEKTITFEPMEVDFNQENETLLNCDGQNPVGDELLSKANAQKANIFKPSSIAIPVFYFTLGFLMTFPRLAIRLYLRDHLGASPGQQAIVFSVVMGMPWNLKVFIGFLSDTKPIRGLRRKPYMFIGTFVCATAWILLGLWPQESLAIGWMCMLLFLGVLGMIVGDVMADALVVERVKFEAIKGSIQAQCWMLRFGGGLSGLLSAGWLLEYGHVHPKSIFFITGFIPLITLLPSVYLLKDERVITRGSQMTQSKEKLWALWDALQTKNIWAPMLFLYAFACTPNASDAFANFLLGPLEFTASTLTYLGAVGMASQLVGAHVYKKYLSDVNWHKLFFITLCAGCALSASQLILVARLNVKVGIPDAVFAFGDEIVNDVIVFILQMPTLIMCAALCPKGIEGVLYALMVCVNNIALSVGGAISAALIDSLGITNTNFDRLFELIVITSLSTLLPILFIPLTPKSSKECQEAAEAMEINGPGNGDGSLIGPTRKSLKKSKLGGGLVVAILTIGLLFSIIESGYKLAEGTRDED